MMRKITINHMLNYQLPFIISETVRNLVLGISRQFKVRLQQAPVEQQYLIDAVVEQVVA